MGPVSDSAVRMPYATWVVLASPEQELGANPDTNEPRDLIQRRSPQRRSKDMLKLAIPIAFATLVVSYVPGHACDEVQAGYSGYSYAAPAVRRAAAYGYAPVVSGYYDDDDYGGYYGGYYGYGGLGLAVGAGIARRAYWRNRADWRGGRGFVSGRSVGVGRVGRSEEHTSELQSLRHLVCRLLL